MKKPLATENAPQAIGPYSQGITGEKIAFVSGQLPLDPKTGAFPEGGIKEQTKQSLTNIKEILKADGYTMNDVVKTTVLLQHIEDFTAMNEVYGEFFEAPFPARAAFEVAALPKGALVEIEAIALRKDADR